MIAFLIAAIVYVISGIACFVMFERIIDEDDRRG